MTKTHKGGFAVESAFSFLEQQVGSYKIGQLNKKRQRLSLAKRATALVTTLVLVTSTSLTMIHAQTEPITDPVPTFDTSLRFDTTSPNPLVVDQNKVEIKPGKSLAQVAREAELAKLAAAKAAKLAAASSVTASAPIKQSSGSVPTEIAHQMAQAAAAKVGIPEHWKILAAIWQKETGKSGDSCIVSKADGRATGPMQFMPSTFRAHAETGANICKASDALVAAADLLKESGLDKGDADRALYSYNHSVAYVNSVKQIANSIQ
jgi:membrane-bound lytic murein transglycosylase B